ncbi:hypothetical protein C8R47DRAFT_1322252, partial [Mycena vitilis]
STTSYRRPPPSIHDDTHNRKCRLRPSHTSHRLLRHESTSEHGLSCSPPYEKPSIRKALAGPRPSHHQANPVPAQKYKRVAQREPPLGRLKRLPTPPIRGLKIDTAAPASKRWSPSASDGKPLLDFSSAGDQAETSTGFTKPRGRRRCLRRSEFLNLELCSAFRCHLNCLADD